MSKDIEYKDRLLFDHRQCKGCGSEYNSCHLRARHMEYDNIVTLDKLLNCPCVECIVKIVCDTYCKLWISYDTSSPRY